MNIKLRGLDFTKKEVQFGQKSQLRFRIDSGLGCEIKVVFKSVSKNDIEFEIFDEIGESTGKCRVTYASSHVESIAIKLYSDLNVLFDQFDIYIRFHLDDFFPFVKEACHKCESLSGNGLDAGDCIITFF